jgi:hypothetical protein
LACARRTISVAATAWSGSVVRMNRSAVMPKRSNVAFHVAAQGSISSCGSIPFSLASRSTLAECSSKPVRKRVSRPSRRWYRAMTSAPIASNSECSAGRSLG